MRTERLNASSSLILLFIGVSTCILAETRSSFVTGTSQEDSNGNRKSEEANLEHGMNLNEFLPHEDASDGESMKVKRRIGSEFLGKRTANNFHSGMEQFLDKRKALGSEFLGKRKLGSEFLGKRTLQNGPGEEYPEDEDDVTSSRLLEGYPRFSHYQLYNDFPTLASKDNGIGEEPWNRAPILLKRGLGSEFLGKRDVPDRPFNFMSKWNRVYGPRLPIDHERKRKLMGSEFLG